MASESQLDLNLQHTAFIQPHNRATNSYMNSN